jgi:plastocyanin
MRRTPVRKLLAVGAVLAGVTLVPATAALSSATTVRVGDNWFKPKLLTVEQHSTVTWRFVGNKVHNVTVIQGPVRFSSPSRSSGTYRRHLTKRGTYRIVCSIHKGRQKMTLTVE